MKVTVPAAASATNPSLTSVAVPLYKVASFTGAVSATGSNSVTITSGTFTANQFSSPAAPHLLHVKSGANVGRHFRITANTANQITVDPRGTDLTALLAANDLFEILPAWTLGTLFPNPVPFTTNADPAIADNVLLWNGGWEQFFHDGTTWRTVGLNGQVLPDDQTSAIIYPDEGMFVVRRAQAPLDLVLLGTVPSTNERTEIEGQTSSFVANRFPVDRTLLQLGFHNLPGWQKGASAAVSDRLSVWNAAKGNWDSYYHNGTNWKRGAAVADSVVVPANTAVFVTRASAGQLVLENSLPYSLN